MELKLTGYVRITFPFFMNKQPGGIPIFGAFIEGALS